MMNDDIIRVRKTDDRSDYLTEHHIPKRSIDKVVSCPGFYLDDETIRVRRTDAPCFYVQYMDSRGEGIKRCKSDTDFMPRSRNKLHRFWNEFINCCLMYVYK
eukprot:maker-scaffold_3-snap-gene-13.41-mRNA-1 protein AED:0.36 eAED:0.43 QI:60/0/0.5/1/0/0/2/0/101